MAGFGEGRLLWTDGSRKAGLAMDPAGNLYGTTREGAYHYGALFEITPLR